MTTGTGARVLKYPIPVPPGNPGILTYTISISGLFVLDPSARMVNARHDSLARRTLTSSSA